MTLVNAEYDTDGIVFDNVMTEEEFTNEINEEEYNKECEATLYDNGQVG